MSNVNVKDFEACDLEDEHSSSTTGGAVVLDITGTVTMQAWPGSTGYGDTGSVRLVIDADVALALRESLNEYFEAGDGK